MAYFDFRSFIREKVLIVDDELIEHKDGFNRDNISTIVTESGFHILPERFSSDFTSSQCDNYEDTMDVSLQLIFCGGRYVADNIDRAIGVAHCVRNELIKRDQYPVANTLVRINVTDVVIEPADTNDNTVIVNLGLVLLLKYCTDNC